VRQNNQPTFYDLRDVREGGQQSTAPQRPKLSITRMRSGSGHFRSRNKKNCRRTTGPIPFTGNSRLSIALTSRPAITRSHSPQPLLRIRSPRARNRSAKSLVINAPLSHPAARNRISTSSERQSAKFAGSISLSFRSPSPHRMSVQASIGSPTESKQRDLPTGCRADWLSFSDITTLPVSSVEQ